MQLAGNGRPILWHLEISHYNEKVRWALDYKRIPHVRRALLPGVHMFVTKHLTGDTPTTPVLTVDGQSIGDSTRIIAAIEERWPEPRLYPKNASQRRRALRLEEFFDEELGPHIRLAAYHELLPRPELVRPLFEHGQPPVARALIRAAWPLVGVLIRRHFSIDAQSAEDSRGRVQAAMDRLESEIRPSGYLVGDTFSVADLTAAALFYPVVRPPEFPYPAVSELPPVAKEFLDELGARPGGQWVAEMYRRHRRPEVGPPTHRQTSGGGIG
jgi:glutathione S-transferase